MVAQTMPPFEGNVRVFQATRRHKATYDYARPSVLAAFFQKIPLIPLLVGGALVMLLFVESEGEDE